MLVIPIVMIFYLPWQLILIIVFAAGLLYYLSKHALSTDKPLPSPTRSAIQVPDPFTGFDYEAPEKLPETADGTDGAEAEGSGEADEDDEGEEEKFRELEAEMERRTARSVPKTKANTEVEEEPDDEGEAHIDQSSYDEITSYVEKSFSPSWVRDEADLEAKLFAQLNIRFPGMVQRTESRTVEDTGIEIEETFGLDALLIESEKDLLAAIGRAAFVADNYDRVAMVLFIDRYLASKIDIQPYLSRLEEAGIDIIVKEGFLTHPTTL